MKAKVDPDSAVHQVSSQGHNLSGGQHLDMHFEALRSEYEATLRAVGFQPGWHVLDAGCGNGAFLPLMTELVGPTGRVSAIDLALENVESVRCMVRNGLVRCAVDVQVGSITALPYEDRRFDAVWCANVIQYLTDEQLVCALREFKRVVKPGGLVAVKEADISVWQFQPQDPLLIWRWVLAMQGDTQMVGAMKGTRLPLWFRNAGMTELVSKTTFAERRQPLRRVECDYIRSNLEFLSKKAAALSLPAEDHEAWRKIAANPDALLHDPDFCYRELWGLTIAYPVRADRIGLKWAVCPKAHRSGPAS